MCRVCYFPNGNIVSGKEAQQSRNHLPPLEELWHVTFGIATVYSYDGILLANY